MCSNSREVKDAKTREELSKIYGSKKVDGISLSVKGIKQIYEYGKVTMMFSEELNCPYCPANNDVMFVQLPVSLAEKFGLLPEGHPPIQEYKIRFLEWTDHYEPDRIEFIGFGIEIPFNKYLVGATFSFVSKIAEEEPKQLQKSKSGVISAIVGTAKVY